MAKGGTEEIIRQLFIQKLLLHYRTPKARIVEEYAVQMGVARKRADVAVLTEEHAPLILCEVKQHLEEESIPQLRSYMIASGAPFGVLASAENYLCFALNEEHLADISDLPHLSDFINPRAKRTKSGIQSDQTIPKQQVHLDFVAPLLSGNFKVLLDGREFVLKEKQLFNFRNFRREIVKSGVFVQASFSQKEWEEYLYARIEQCHCETVQSSSVENPQTEVHTLEDNVISFLENRTVKGAYIEIPKAELYGEYKKYCEGSNDWPCGKKRFSQRMMQLGYKERHGGNVRFWRGVGLSTHSVVGGIVMASRS